MESRGIVEAGHRAGAREVLRSLASRDRAQRRPRSDATPRSALDRARGRRHRSSRGGIGGIVTLIVLSVTRGETAAASARAPRPTYIPAPLPTGSSDAHATRSGRCRRNDVDRRRTTYVTATRGRGAAKTLRGKVAIVHFKVGGDGDGWSRSESEAVTRTALASRAYLLAEARRWKVTDLDIDAIEWPVPTRRAVPTLRVSSGKKPSAQEGEVFRRAMRELLEEGVGRSLAVVVDDLASLGYDNASFVVSVPDGPRGIRDFAAPTGAKGDAAELAYALEPDWDVVSRSMLVTHEVLHLFGADDLYEVRGVAADEENDLMNAECDGLGPTSIGASTAYAIGWTSAPPQRAYAFSDR